MTREICFSALIGLAAGAACLSSLQAQAAKSVWDGIYTAAQAAQGESIFAKQCASCHGADLQGGGPMPALTGDEFRKEWNGQSVGDLFERMRTSMPADHPGTLSLDDNARVLAYILKANEFPAGASELKGEAASLSTIRFEAAKPAK